ncbi:MFS transporter [Paenibacillus oenotherae]|uniref:MFS transporter n=1 Tax=Paenibacillus oenotherae TaxID=1435645 RepID=A0ABS7D4W9_9BACL|nr:MFS transporter [Paenibacillus oenotherae]MBW7474901.1 MFS transporter [Paenibacillus oenotherae]
MSAAANLSVPGAVRLAARARFVLLGCVFLGLFSEVLLSPYYPQFFAKVFGVEGIAFTGIYLFICRLTAVICSPLWGMLTKRFEAKRLLFVGQLGTAACTALMAAAETAGQFIAVTVILILFKSSYILIYPMIIELTGQDKRAGAAGIFHAVYHAAVILSTLAGAHMLKMDNPLTLFYYAAALDTIQLGVCVWALKHLGRSNSSKAQNQRDGSGLGQDQERDQGQDSGQGQAQAEAAAGVQVGGAELAGTGKQAAASASSRTGSRLAAVLKNSMESWNGTVLLIGALFFTMMIACNMIRPYFTPYMEGEYGLDTVRGGWLFLVPNAMAVLALPLIRRWCVAEHLTKVYGLGMALMAVGLLLQAADSLPLLIAGRAAFGLCMALTMAALDIMLFNQSEGGQMHAHFGIIVAFQNLGELASPLMATSLVQQGGLAAPFIGAAIISAVNLVLFAGFMRMRKHWRTSAAAEASL